MSESHTNQHFSKPQKWVDQQSQVLHSSQTLVSHTSRELLITQEPLLWIQTLSSGKELPSMMVRYTERKTSKVMQMNSKHILRNKRLLLMSESHTNQHFSKPQKWVDQQSQVLHLSQTLVSLILLEHFTTQEPLKWIQMLSSGKELLSMMVRYTERKTSKLMQMNSRHILRNRRLLLMLESHTSQHFSKPNKWILMKMLSLLPVRHSKLLDKYH